MGFPALLTTIPRRRLSRMDRDRMPPDAPTMAALVLEIEGISTAEDRGSFSGLYGTAQKVADLLGQLRRPESEHHRGLVPTPDSTRAVLSRCTPCRGRREEPT